jgi:hypothetical protein
LATAAQKTDDGQAVVLCGVPDAAGWLLLLPVPSCLLPRFLTPPPLLPLLLLQSKDEYKKDDSPYQKDDAPYKKDDSSYKKDDYKQADKKYDEYKKVCSC